MDVAVVGVEVYLDPGLDQSQFLFLVIENLYLSLHKIKKHMEMVASITRYKDGTSFINWLKKLPRKYSVEKIEKMMAIYQKGMFLLWTEKGGVKIL